MGNKQSNEGNNQNNSVYQPLQNMNPDLNMPMTTENNFGWPWSKPEPPPEPSMEQTMKDNLTKDPAKAYNQFKNGNYMDLFLNLIKKNPKENSGSNNFGSDSGDENEDDNGDGGNFDFGKIADVVKNLDPETISSSLSSLNGLGIDKIVKSFGTGKRRSYNKKSTSSLTKSRPKKRRRSYKKSS